MLELAILLFSIVTNLTVGLLAFIKNPKSITNVTFGVLTFALSTWSLLSYVSVVATTHQLLLVRLVMLFVVIMNTAFFLVIRVFPSVRYKLSFKNKLGLAYALLVAAITQTPLLFSHIEISNGAITPVPAPGILLFLIHAALFVVGGGILLILRVRRAKGAEKQQLKLILFGTVLLFTLLPLSNFVLPVVLRSDAFIGLSPIYTSMFAVATGYAIIKHRMFNVRAVIARAIAYVLTLGLLASGFAIFAFLVSDLLLSGASETTRQITNALVAVLLALTYNAVKGIFDHFTNKLFYRDAYDSEEVARKIGTVLAEEFELDAIVQKTIEALKEPLKPLYIEIAVVDEGQLFKLYKSGKVKKSMPIDQLEFFAHKSIVIEYELEEGQMKKIMREYDVSMSVRLHTQDEIVGYILLGPKSSGNIYTSQDLRLLEILSKEIAIGVQNARSIKKIADFNITLQHKINEATSELKRTNQKLRDLDAAKDEFISMASHQLRTPLTSVKGYIDMVLQGDVGKPKPEQAKLLRNAFASSQKMVYLIADLLNVSRLRTGKFVLEPIETNLADVVEGEVEQLKETAKGREVSLEYKKPANFPKLMLDETKIRQVMMNFMDNAIYYTKAGGNILVELKDLPNSIEFTVKDNGIGVPKADQKNLFTKFYRAGNARKARPDGTGLGLFMAKKVVVAHGGAIIFRSEEGKGSTFGFTFPKNKLKIS